jgi:hypothetical protein
MKKSILKLLALSSLVVLASSAAEFTMESNSANSLSENEERRAPRDQRDDQAAIRRMDARKMEILSRVGMSAPLDATETTDPVTGVDSVQELYDSGFIIPATLEDVESALHAAAQTPEAEDDTAALILMHRGSYRFFTNQ